MLLESSELDTGSWAETGLQKTPRLSRLRESWRDGERLAGESVIIIKTPITNVLDAERRRRHLSERLMPWLLQDKVGALNLLQNVVLKFEPLTANYLHNEE